MPETPNFEQIAASFVDSLVAIPTAEDVANTMRLVWNARGAADLAAIDALDRVDLDTPLAVTLTHSQDAIRGLDR